MFHSYGGEELTVEGLAREFFISRYYLMHRFKEMTGYTVHQYISEKRLLRAGELIRSGVPVLQAAEQTGFRDYSTFLRAFRRLFGASPRALGAAGEEPPPPAGGKP